MAQVLNPVMDRAYGGNADWRALHDLAVDAYRQTGRWRTWTPDRFDGFLRGRIYDELTGKANRWQAGIRLWEQDGQLVAAVHPEGPEEAYLEVRPGWERVLPRMLEWAERRHRERRGDADPEPPLQTYATADDASLQALLAARGYRDMGPMEVLHRRALAIPWSDAPIPRGYRLRQPDLKDPRDRDRFIDLTRLVFGVTFDAQAIALERRMLTHREYVVAETDDGEFAAWCGVWSVPEIGTGQFEPVGTHPDHRRRGLASAVMTRGLEWMRRRGMATAWVGTGARNASNALYASLGFELAETYHQWEWLPMAHA
jgi:mycothiol synthase